MSTSETDRQETAIAKLFMHGRSQAVRLPKAFRFQGSEVKVSRIGDKVILEPVDKPRFDVEAWWAKLRSYRDIDFPEVTDEPPVTPDPDVSFDPFD
ncbi:MAG: AbrB/MazE/SpoVT family DNA-binding domain-containing protein [Rhodospirillales bacterium]|nr:MAG: AbrB/MazE/SpoVT family DNA-binding domain-containing protein [Rhodospirillales bacterium]